MIFIGYNWLAKFKDIFRRFSHLASLPSRKTIWSCQKFAVSCLLQCKRLRQQSIINVAIFSLSSNAECCWPAIIWSSISMLNFTVLWSWCTYHTTPKICSIESEDLGIWLPSENGIGATPLVKSTCILKFELCCWENLWKSVRSWCCLEKDMLSCLSMVVVL